MASDRRVLPSLGGFIELLAALEPSSSLDEGGIFLDELAVDVPLELSVTARGGQVTSLSGSSPTQIVSTSVMPVFHRLVVRIAAENDPL